MYWGILTQPIRGNAAMLIHCWSTVADGGPTMNQRFAVRVSWDGPCWLFSLIMPDMRSSMRVFPWHVAPPPPNTPSWPSAYIQRADFMQTLPRRILYMYLPISTQWEGHLRESPPPPHLTSPSTAQMHHRNLLLFTRLDFIFTCAPSQLKTGVIVHCVLF